MTSVPASPVSGHRGVETGLLTPMGPQLDGSRGVPQGESVQGQGGLPADDLTGVMTGRSRHRSAKSLGRSRSALRRSSVGSSRSWILCAFAHRSADGPATSATDLCPSSEDPGRRSVRARGAQACSMIILNNTVRPPSPGEGSPHVRPSPRSGTPDRTRRHTSPSPMARPLPTRIWPSAPLWAVPC